MLTLKDYILDNGGKVVDCVGGIQNEMIHALLGEANLIFKKLGDKVSLYERDHTEQQQGQLLHSFSLQTAQASAQKRNTSNNISNLFR